jgi:hypothetical protein
VLRGFKDKNDFHKIIGNVVYLDAKYEEMPTSNFGKYRYLQVDNFNKVFEIFVGNESGDFKPYFEKIDSIKIGDRIEIYYDIDEMESNNKINSLIQFIDKDSTPYFIRGNEDKILGIGILSFGLIGFLVLLILKLKKIIE